LNWIDGDKLNPIIENLPVSPFWQGDYVSVDNINLIAFGKGGCKSAGAIQKNFFESRILSPSFFSLAPLLLTIDDSENKNRTITARGTIAASRRS